MTKQNKARNMWKLMLALIVGVFVSAFSFGAVSRSEEHTSEHQSLKRI